MIKPMAHFSPPDIELRTHLEITGPGYIQHLVMYPAVTRYHIRFVHRKRRAGQVRQSSSSFGHDQRSGCSIPGAQGQLPETVKPATSYVAQVYGCCPCSTECLGRKREIRPVVQIRKPRGPN